MFDVYIIKENGSYTVEIKPSGGGNFNSLEVAEDFVFDLEDNFDIENVYELELED